VQGIQGSLTRHGVFGGAEELDEARIGNDASNNRVGITGVTGDTRIDQMLP
jgi:hypothetical protein